MIRRHQLAVRSPVSPRALARAAAAAVVLDRSHFAPLASTLREELDARRVTFTDRGTSALVLALRVAAGEAGVVAFPAYSCIDLTAAAVRAGIRVRLYDLDPSTLSPDLDSVRAALGRGVNALLVAHLYGYPADMDGIRSVAEPYGVPIIEDAAQSAGATLRGRPLGSFGGLTVLSFGRGKGITGGNGGALVTRDETWLGAVEQAGASLGVPSAGWGDVAGAAAQWLLGRPSLYSIPAAIPWLRLGEMVYRPAREPAVMSAASATLVAGSFSDARREVGTRRRHARILDAEARRAHGLQPVVPIDAAEPGYLRFAVRETGGRGASPAAGIMRGYPLTLAEQRELAPCLCAGERDGRGAVELRRTLLTLPTHGALDVSDLRRIAAWMSTPPDAARPVVSPIQRDVDEAMVARAEQS
ncbi:MAG: DegT/DnrJ/EryC1/StrS family aminotransferase [Gemmatimonadaceae bacterium]